jgi:adenylylsulfate kinase
MQKPDRDSADPVAPVAKNIVWHAGTVLRTDRERLLGQRGGTVWFTGLSGSGKSTVAVRVEELLRDRGRLAYRLDGDNVRHGLNRDLGFSPQDRTENVRRVGEVCRLLGDCGVITLACLVSPYRADRQSVRDAHAAIGLPFLEVHVDVPLEVAERRDPKRLYAGARQGTVGQMTGVAQPYEPPIAAELVLPTHEIPLEECATRVLGLLVARGLLPA